MNIAEAFKPRSLTADKQTPKFEIWFSVIVDAENQRALWVRYTTLQSQALVWGSLFDARDDTNHCFGTQKIRMDNISLQPDAAKFDKALATPSQLTGQVDTDKGALNWDINLSHRHGCLEFMPSWFGRSNIPGTKSVVCSPLADASGKVSLANQSFEFDNAGAVFTHIWGKQRIDELSWTFVPRFDNDDEGWSLEIVSIRPNVRLPSLLFFCLHGPDGFTRTHSALSSAFGKSQLQYPSIFYHTQQKDFDLRVESHLHPTQITPYIYRDPDATPYYIEQSDLGTVRCQITLPNRTVNLISTTAAVEFHGTSAWSQAPYLDPYAKE